MKLKFIFFAIFFTALIVFGICDGLVKAAAYNVIDYGAKCDGTTDDTASIQSAINAASAAGGGTVSLPVGTCIVSVNSGTGTSVVPKSNVTLQGVQTAGSIIKLTPPLGNYLAVFYNIAGVSNWSMYDLTVDQQGSLDPVTGSANLYNYPRAIFLSYSGSSFHIERCRFTNINNDSVILLNGVNDNIWIEDNTFDNVGTATGIDYDHSTIYTSGQSNPTTNIHINRNHFSGTVAGGGAFGARTAIEAHGGGEISGNVVDGYNTMAILGCVAEDNCGGQLNFFNNTATNVAIGVNIWNVSLHAMTGTQVVNNNITINRDPWLAVNNPVYAAGITFYSGNTQSVSSPLISGNTITFLPTAISYWNDMATAGIALAVNDSTIMNSGIQVVNNTIHNPFASGIQVSIKSDNLQITDNTIYNPGQSASNFNGNDYVYKVGIHLIQTHSNMTISGNQFIDNQVTATMIHPIFNQTDPASTNLQALDNTTQITQSDEAIMYTPQWGSMGVFYLRHAMNSYIQPYGTKYAVGSTILETGTGKTWTQTAAPSGATWVASISDSTAPTPGSSGAITTTSITSNSLTLNWTKGTDNTSAQSTLKYRVYKSSSNNISTVANMYANGTPLNATTTDIATLSVTGLSPSATYYFNVIVQDGAGNTAVYTAKSQATDAAPIITYTLSLTSSNGTVSKSPDQASYASGSSVSLTATVNFGYSFSSWSGDASGSTNPLTVTMNGNKNITANFSVNIPAPSGGGSGGGSGFYTPPITPPATTTPVTIAPGSATTPAASPLRLINASGTFYLIKNSQRFGITSPGILYSYGFEFKDAKSATAADLGVTQGSLLLPGNGYLVKSNQDKTVYLISQNQRYAFVSASVFLSLGFSFGHIFNVTDPELQSLPRAENISNGSSRHLPGLDINKSGTIYWVGTDNQLHGYPSLVVYNSWRRDNDFSQVVPANSADSLQPAGDLVAERVVE